MRWYDRLRRSGEIAFVRRTGKRAGLPTLTAYAVSGRGRPRVAIAASKAVGPAVTRNLVRRRIRGALDELPPLREPLRLLLVAKPGAGAAPYARLAADVAAALGSLERAPTR